MKSSGFLSEGSNTDAAAALQNAIDYMKTDEYLKRRDRTNVIPTHAKHMEKEPKESSAEDKADDVASWREARLAELRRARNASKDKVQFPEITEKEFFEGVIQREGGNRQTVIHLFKDSFQTCQIVNQLIESIALKTGGITFVRINAEKAPFLVQKFEITMLPSLLFFRDESVIDRIVGLDNFGGTEISEDVLLEAIRSRFEK